MQTRQAWVVGGSGGVGRFLLRRLAAANWSVLTTSRHAMPRWAQRIEGLHWQQADLADAETATPTRMHAVFGAGPLDLLLAVLVRSPLARGACVVALSSTSVDTRRTSLDPVERDYAQRLADSESALRALSAQHGWRLVLIRPTLIYGAGVDRSITPLRRRAQRWGFLPLPRASRGLRQPVHADDLASAMLEAAMRSELDDACLQLPGGEVLRFDEMVLRTLSSCDPVPHLLRLPGVPLKVLSQTLSKLPARLARWAAPLARSAEDLQVSDADWNLLGLRPRGFQPEPRDFDTEE